LESKPKTSKSKRSIFSLRPKAATEVKEHDHEHDHKGEATQVLAGKVEQEKPQVKQAPKSQEKIKKNLVNLKRRLFNRKSGG
jgi:ribosomal protein L29